MSSLFRLIKNAGAVQAWMVVSAMAVLLAGCRSESGDVPLTTGASTPDLDAEIARATSLRQPVLVLVTESGLGRADDHARKVFENMTASGTGGGMITVLLDVSFSRNRATAARYHATETPLLLSLSPRGLIITRDQKPITKGLVLERAGEVSRRSGELDAKLASFEIAVGRNGNDAGAQMEFADFLIAQQNALEAIPHLELVAHSESADIAQRVRAWVALARAHFWIAEPEKGRHEAQKLIAVLGPKSVEAVAGGNLALATQDANAKRIALAREEFDAAIVAAPDSVYAKQAADALAKLPGGDK